MNHEITGTELGTGATVFLATLSIVRLPMIAELCGEYLPVFQAAAAFVAFLCGMIVLVEKFIKGWKDK